MWLILVNRLSDTKIRDNEDKITIITNVITAAALTAALTAVRNNIPDVSNLFKNEG